MADASTVAEIRSSIKDKILSITENAGFRTTMPESDHFYTVYNSTVAMATDDKYFPKFFLLLDGFGNKRRVSGKYERDISFLLIAVFKETLTEPGDVQEVVENFIEDVDLLFHMQHDLGGLVQDIALTDATTDAGATHPEGIALMRLTVKQYLNRP